MPIRRGAKGTDLGGQFIGPKSIARALVKMMTPHEAETHDAGVKARTPKGGSAIGRLMARPSKASARMTPATHAAIAADHRASFGPAKAPHGDALAAARAHVAGMQRKAGGTPSAPSAPHPDAHAIEQENRVRAAYRDLPKAPVGGWVGLADIRDALPDMSRKDQDAALMRLAMGQFGPSGSRVIPVANTKALKPRDRAAALRIGVEDTHALTINDPSPLPVPSAPSHTAAPSAPKKATPSQIIGMTDEELVAAHAEGRVTAGQAAKDLRRRAAGFEDAAVLRRGVAPNPTSAPLADKAAELHRMADRITATPAKKSAAAKMTRAKATQPPVTPDMLRNATSPDDIAPLLEGRTAADLRQIAGDAGIHVGSKATKDQLKQTILQHGVQRRLNSHAVSGPGPKATTVRPVEVGLAGDVQRPFQSEPTRPKPTGPQAHQTALIDVSGARQMKGQQSFLDELGTLDTTATPAKKSSSPTVAGPAIEVATGRGVLATADIAAGRNLTPAGRAALDALGPAGHPDIAAKATAEDKVRAAYRMLDRPDDPGTYVALSDIRKLIGEQVPRSDVDAALKALDRESANALVPQSYARGYNTEERLASAVFVGGQEQNMLKLGPDATPSGAPTSVRPAKKTTAAQKMTRGKAAKVKAPAPQPADTVAKLKALGDRAGQVRHPERKPYEQAARDALAGHSAAELKALVEHLNKYRGGHSKLMVTGTRAELIDRIIARGYTNQVRLGPPLRGPGTAAGTGN